jgi:hypothetical protein
LYVKLSDRLTPASDVREEPCVRKWSRNVFETIAFLSTVAMVIVFVALYQMDRRGRQEEEK